ncbi:YuzB family protein [Lederbergia wuyishanensis]|uniref:YuzB family protein n=1 Tax=Lederbergia wuyishanensis TaxID=1347903 RepID=UPI001FD486EA|nr:YuzB family protein [Lederbergia wuyishanensis]MCJ8009450.1 YuzB family protein [Lederbergia wuyishanensis]
MLLNPIIEFCISNLGSGGYEALQVLEEDPNLDIVEYGCLDHCDLCAESLYALVNGEVVTGETPEMLVKAIYQYIEENPMF